jgi:hypothetical protein
MPSRSKQEPWYPAKELTYGSIFFYIKNKTHIFNAFDAQSILEAKVTILKEAYKASPSYKLFMKAAIAATGLSERTIKKLIYQTPIKEK